MPNLTAPQANTLRALYRGARLYVYSDFTYSSELYRVSRFRRALVIEPGNAPLVYDAKPFEELLAGGFLKGKSPAAAGHWCCHNPMEEWHLTDAGAKAIGHDTAEARKVEVKRA